MLLWCDTETTGLEAREQRLLEVACIVTDDQFTEVARFHRVTNEARTADYSRIDPIVLKMHHENGLWADSIAYGVPLAQVDKELAEFIQQHAVVVPEPKFDAGGQNTQKPPVKPQLAGSTVSFDRGFLEVHTPLSAKLLHYRNLDTTSINELARRTWPAVHDARPREEKIAHRAMPDIEHSLAVARYYTNALSATPAMITLATGVVPPVTAVTATAVTAATRNIL